MCKKVSCSRAEGMVWKPYVVRFSFFSMFLFSLPLRPSLASGCYNFTVDTSGFSVVMCIFLFSLSVSLPSVMRAACSRSSMYVRGGTRGLRAVSCVCVGMCAVCSSGRAWDLSAYVVSSQAIDEQLWFIICVI